MRACVCVHGGHRVHGWLVSVIVSEQEHTWDAASGGPESLSCFRAPLSGSSPALATVRTFMMYLCIVHDRKGDGLPPPPPPTHPLPISQSAARGGARTQDVCQTEPGVRTVICEHGSTPMHMHVHVRMHMRLWGKCAPLMPSPGLCLLL